VHLLHRFGESEPGLRFFVDRRGGGHARLERAGVTAM
jgi:hypothetical protein